MKLTKLLIGSTLAIPAIAVPLTTITSCSQTWGNKTPFMIGSTLASDEDAPYSKLRGSNYLDADGVDMKYLQSNYAVQTSSGAYYAYSAPKKWTNNEDEDRHDWKDDGNCGWYNAADTAFNSVGTYKDADDKVQTIYNVQNSALASNINFVSQIGYNISTYISFALQYQASQIKITDDKADDSNIKHAWGDKFTLKHDGETDQNNKFYEHIFALANLIGPGKAEALLRNSAVNFNFIDMPLPSYTFTNVNDEKTRNIDSRFAQLLEKQDDFTTPKYYTNLVEGKEKVGDVEDVEYTDYTYNNVPIRVQFRNMEQTYVNPTKAADSFIVNDYYATTQNVMDAVGNQWKDKMPIFTDRQADDCIPHYQTYRFDATNSEHSISKGESADERIKDLLGDQFICLMSYRVRIYKVKDGVSYSYKNTASINQLETFFPAYFLDIADSLTDDSLKGGVYKDLTHGEGESQTTVRVIDYEKINRINTWFINLIKRASDEGRQPDITKLKADSKILLNFLGYMFDDSTNGLDTARFLSTTDLPK